MPWDGVVDSLGVVEEFTAAAVVVFILSRGTALLALAAFVVRTLRRYMQVCMK